MSPFRGVVVLASLAGLVLPCGDIAALTTCDGAEPDLASVAAALDEGRWDDAENSLQPLESSHPECSQVVVAVARLCAARGDPEEAERRFSRALSMAPDDAVAHALFARFQLSRGLVPQAAYLVSLSLTIDPDCVEGLVVRGQILGHRGFNGESRAVLERAVALDPTSAEAHHELGAWFFRVNLREQAVRQFEAAIALNSQNARSHGYLAVSLEMLGRDEPAGRHYRTALLLQGKGGPFLDPTLDYNYGRFLLKQGHFEESQTHLDRAVSQHPLRRGPRYERAKLGLAREKYQAAREDAERALSLGKPGDYINDVQVYYLLNTIYRRLGETALAEKFAELARTTEIPDQSEALRRR